MKSNSDQTAIDALFDIAEKNLLDECLESKDFTDFITSDQELFVLYDEDAIKKLFSGENYEKIVQASESKTHKRSINKVAKNYVLLLTHTKKPIKSNPSTLPFHAMALAALINILSTEYYTSPEIHVIYEKAWWQFW